MRNRCRLLGIVCLLVVLPACDAEQPQSIPSQLAQVQFRTLASTNVYDVWERYVDADQDGLPDQFDSQGNPIDPPIEVQCRQVFEGGQPLRVQGDSVPFPHSVEILVLRAGETEPERLTSEAALDENFNLTPYDSLPAGSQPNPPCSAPEVCVRLGRLTAASRLVMESRYEDLDREVINLPGGQQVFPFRCPGSPGLGDPRLGGTPAAPAAPPFAVELNTGDTIIVRARKGSNPLNGLELISQPTLSATLTVGGLRVDATGQTATSLEQGAGLSFSYTLK